MFEGENSQLFGLVAILPTYKLGTSEKNLCIQHTPCDHEQFEKAC